MKRKTIYALILVCCLGLISSANQSNRECGETSLCISLKESAGCQKATIPAKTAANTDAASVPLNLFLFEL